MRSKWLAAVMLMALLGSYPGKVAADQLYFNDFSTAVGPGWSASSETLTITTAPLSPNQKFLGTNATWGLSNNTVTLSFANLPGHTDLTLTFDLYIIRSWDGNAGGSIGPDRWSLAIQGGSTLLDTTFSNWSGQQQSYPGNYPSNYPYQTGNSGINTLRYSDFFGTNAEYHLTYTIPHTANTVAFDFKAWGLQEITDESWGLDNVKVEYTPTVIPLPGGLLLLGSGLVGLGALGLRRRSRS